MPGWTGASHQSAQSDFQTVMGLCCCDGTAMAVVTRRRQLDQFEMQLCSGTRYSVKIISLQVNRPPEDCVQWPMPTEWRGKQSSASAKRAKKVNSSSCPLPLGCSSRTGSSRSAFISEPLASAAHPTLMHRVRPGWRQQRALSVCQHRLTFFLAP